MIDICGTDAAGPITLADVDHRQVVGSRPSEAGHLERVNNEHSPVTVDVHAHLMLPQVEQLVAGQLGLATTQRRELGFLGIASAAENNSQMGELAPRLTDAAMRIAHMDATAVDAQLVSVSPAQYHYWAEAGLAREIAIATNEGVLDHIERHPHRLSGIGTVPLQHPDLAVEMLEHAMSIGLRGIEISTYAYDLRTGEPIELSDGRLDRLWARATELDALVLVHPFGCTLGARLAHSYLANTVGQPMEHTVALSQLIFGGVFDRHPDLRLLATHGGGYLPSYLGRSDRAWRARQDAHTCELRPSSYLSRILVDSLVLDPGELHRLIARMGADRVLLGSDYPFDMGEDEPVSALRLAGLSNADFAAVAGGNAVRLGLAPAIAQHASAR